MCACDLQRFSNSAAGRAQAKMELSAGSERGGGDSAAHEQDRLMRLTDAVYR